MAKRANVRLFWKRSVSTDLDKINIQIAIDGVVTNTDLPVETEEFMVKVNANSSFSFNVKTTDKEGFETTSELYAAVLGDLEAPQPATDLGHEVTSIEDVPEVNPLEE